MNGNLSFFHKFRNLWSERSSPKKVRGQDHASLDQTPDVIDSATSLKIFAKKKIITFSKCSPSTYRI
jgi:hypothetical protein